MNMKRAVALALGAVLAAGAARAGSPPSGADARRAAAEIRIMAGDVQRLGRDDVPDAHKQGLRARLRGAASSLPLLIRAAGGREPEAIEALRAALDAEPVSRGVAASLLDALAWRHPLDLTGIWPAEATAERLARGRAIHEETCAGCHPRGPAPETPLPARDLFAMAAEEDPATFAARLLVGVRGDALTALANPLSDQDLAALMALYRRAGAAQPQ